MKNKQNSTETIRDTKKQAKLEKLSIKEMVTLKGGGRSKPGSWT